MFLQLGLITVLSKARSPQISVHNYQKLYIENKWDISLSSPEALPTVALTIRVVGHNMTETNRTLGPVMSTAVLYY